MKTFLVYLGISLLIVTGMMAFLALFLWGLFKLGLWALIPAMFAVAVFAAGALTWEAKRRNDA